MPSTLPALFLSHGSPMLAITQGPTQDFLKGLAATLPRPKAILAVSAHWEAPAPAVSVTAQPDTIHDFYGFPPPLYEIAYPAPGAPAVGARAAELLEAAGFAVTTDADRGFDHGVWVPIGMLYPQADIPIAQVAIQPEEGPAHHFRMGEALAPLREDGVLIVTTGSLTHNLREFRGQPVEAPPPDWVSGFADWIAEKVAAGDDDALLDYRGAAPEATRNHPTDEHLLPLFVALGAGPRGRPGRRLFAGYTHGVLAMDAYAFG